MLQKNSFNTLYLYLLCHTYVYISQYSCRINHVKTSQSKYFADKTTVGCRKNISVLWNTCVLLRIARVWHTKKRIT
uniref:Uncharacterized protein n=1 Tax=Anguilla anguilla TaxID=7936 RepID=A0A0E9WUE6_ANGAN